MKEIADTLQAQARAAAVQSTGDKEIP